MFICKSSDLLTKTFSQFLIWLQFPTYSALYLAAAPTLQPPQVPKTPPPLPPLYFIPKLNSPPMSYHSLTLPGPSPLTVTVTLASSSLLPSSML